MNRRGVILLLTLIIMVSLVVITVAYVFMVTTTTRNVGAQKNTVMAFYLAEAGINKAIWYLLNTAPNGSTDGSWRTTAYPASPGSGATDPKQETLGSGTYTIWVETSGSNVLVTSQGSINNIQRNIHQTLTVSPNTPEAFAYVQASGGNMVFTGSHNGTINGDLSAHGSVTGLTVTHNGSTTSSSTVETPTVNYAQYQAIANHVVAGNQTFSKNNTYSGVWYVTGDVTVEKNVTFNGTIISRGNITLTGINNTTITATSPNPALVAQGNILAGSLTNVQITGLIFAQGNIVLTSSNNTTLTGSIVAGGDMSADSLNNFTIDFSTQAPPYFSDSHSGGGAGSVSVTSVTNSWSEI